MLQCTLDIALVMVVLVGGLRAAPFAICHLRVYCVAMVCCIPVCAGTMYLVPHIVRRSTYVGPNGPTDRPIGLRVPDRPTDRPTD